MRRPLPTLTDLALAALLATAWMLRIRPAFEANGASVDTLLLALWTAGYLICFLVVIGGLHGVLRRWLGLSHRRGPRWLISIMLVSPALLLVFHFGSERLPPAHPPGAKILAPVTPSAPWRLCLIGIDGCDLRVVEQFVADGELPTFARLLREGTHARLATNSSHSPVVWTSIATGRPGEEHGILGYTANYLRGSSWLAPEHSWDWLGHGLDRAVSLFEEGAIGSNQRRCKAFWELLTEAGRSSLVVSWWATWPAEPIFGTMVSNRAIAWDDFSDETLASMEGRDDLVHPPQLEKEILEITRNTVRKRDTTSLDRDNALFFDARDDVGLEVFFHLSRLDPDLRTVYLQEVDTRSHAWTNNVYGGNTNTHRPMRVSKERAGGLWNAMVADGYRRVDAMLARVFENLREGEALLVVSDHGWEYDGTGHWNRPDGTLLAWGGPFREGVELDRAHVFDILPTLCVLMGLPVSNELPGRVLREAFRPEALPEIAHVASYGRRGRRALAAGRGGDAAHLAALRSLGYIE